MENIRIFQASSPYIVKDQFDGETGFGCSWRAVREEAARAFRLVCIESLTISISKRILISATKLDELHYIFA